MKLEKQTQMEGINAVNALSEENIDNNVANNATIKNKLINTDCTVSSKEEIIASAKYDPNEEIHKKNEDNEDLDNKDLKGKDNINNKRLSNYNNISNSLTENNFDDIESNKESDKDKTQESLETNVNNQKTSVNDKIIEKEENNSQGTPLQTIKRDGIGGSEIIYVNKIVNNVQQNENNLGSTDSLSRRKLQMNKKIQELKESQATLNKAMSIEDHIYKKKDGNALSCDALNLKAKSEESSIDNDDEEENNDEFDEEDDEIFDIEMIRKFEKRNTIHIPMHRRNYENITSSYLRSSFFNVKITEGIENIIKQLFEIVEENIKPIIQGDNIPNIFLKTVNATTNKKDEEKPDFDITTISGDVSNLIIDHKFEDAYNLIVMKVNNNYRLQFCEEVLTTINSIIVLFCLEERIQTYFRDFYTNNYSNFNRDSLLEIMNTVDYISPPENIILANCVYYLIHSKNKKLAPETYKELATCLAKNEDFNYALHVLNDMGRQHWDKKTYQIALDLCIKTKPQKLEYAESLLNDYGKPYIVAKNENSLVPIIISTPLMIGTTEQEIKAMRSYYKELLRKFKWKIALDDFETAKNAIYTKKEMLQLRNAMLELCVTYKEFQHGWSIFQGMTECDKITAQVAITLCREAINYYNDADEQDTYRIGWINRAWDIVISLKDWAVYNMPLIQGKKSKASVKKNLKNKIIISDKIKEKLKDYKTDKDNSGEDQMQNQNSQNEVKRKKSIFSAPNTKPVELPKHLAKSNFNLTNINRNSMISIIAFVLHEVLCIFETVPNMEIFLIHVVEIYNFLTEYNIVEILSDEYLIRPLIRYCLKCRLGEKYKKFNFNTLPNDESKREFSFGNDSAISDEELRANIERMNKRGRSLSVNKNQQMNDILFEHIKNKLKKKIPEPTPEDPEFENDKNQICTRIALECYYNICRGNSDTNISKCHSNTYAMVLHFAIIGNDPKLFENICNDLWYARIQLDEEVVMALQLFHDINLENCKECGEKDHFYSAEVTVKPYKYEKQKFIVLNGIRMRTPLDLSFLKKIGTINGRPYSQEEARKFLNHCINACNPKRKLSMIP